VRARAREAAGGARRDTPLADRLRRACGEDPHVQLSGEPRDRPPDQAHRAPARPRARGRAGRVHGRPRRGEPPARARRVTVREALAETEVVVGRALVLIRADREPRVLDLGVGSGAIALAIADEHPGARVTGVDTSGDALALARENAERLGLGIELRHGGVETTTEGWD